MPAHAVPRAPDDSAAAGEQLTAPRSVLSVPASSERFIVKAATAGADVVMLDLEDGVGASAKADARSTLERTIGQLAATPQALWLRVNQPGGPEWTADLQLVHRLQDLLQAIVVPKADHRMVTDAASLPVPIIALIETAQGVEDCAAVARIPQVRGAMFGSVDYVRDIVAVGALHFTETSHAQFRVVNAAAAAGKFAVAGATTAFADRDSTERDAQAEAGRGFVGKLCLHPTQVSIANRTFRATSAQLDWARRVVAAASPGTGALALDGQMIDEPVIQRARRILASDQVGV